MTRPEASAQARAMFGKRAYARDTGSGKEIVQWHMSLHGQRLDTVLGSGKTWADAFRHAAESHPNRLRHS